MPLPVKARVHFCDAAKRADDATTLVVHRGVKLIRHSESLPLYLGPFEIVP